MNKYKKYLIFFIGTILFSLGISFGNKSLLGGNPMAVLVNGVSKQISLSFGTCNLIVSAIEVIVGYLLDKRNVTWVTIVTMLVASSFIDLAGLFIIESSNIVVRVIYMLVGIALYCLGLGMQQYGKIGYENYDVFIFGLKKAFKVSKYHTIKWIVDGAFLILGFILGAEVGVGTVLFIVFAGILIEFFKELTEKIFK